MKAHSPLVFWSVLAAVTVAGGTALAVQWRHAIDLRVALIRARSDAAELTRLRRENRRLQAQQISPGELERLRADHAALPRLKAELEQLQRDSGAAP